MFGAAPCRLLHLSRVDVACVLPAGRTFTPVERPPDSAGAARGAAADLVMQTRGSKFLKFQEVRIQELAIEVSQLG